MDIKMILHYHMYNSLMPHLQYLNVQSFEMAEKSIKTGCSLLIFEKIYMTYSEKMEQKAVIKVWVDIIESHNLLNSLNVICSLVFKWQRRCVKEIHLSDIAVLQKMEVCDLNGDYLKSFLRGQMFDDLQDLRLEW